MKECKKMIVLIMVFVLGFLPAVEAAAIIMIL